jgi:Ca2+-binding EF-hand superfamily protein
MIMKKLAFTTLVAMGMTTAAIAQQQPSQQTTPRSTQPSTQSTQTPAPRGGDRTEQVGFETADKNGDGRVNREEANDIDGFDFSRADTNNDASLTRQEFMAAMSTSTPRNDAGRDDAGNSGARSGGAQSGQSSASSRSGAGAGAPPAPSSQTSPGAAGGRSNQPGAGSSATAQMTFDTADKNKDGKISRDEANDIRGLNFSTADVNDDASLSRQEFQTAMAGVQPRG